MLVFGLVNGHCHTGQFELGVHSNKLFVYKVGMVIEALACRHRTEEVPVSEASIQKHLSPLSDHKRLYWTCHCMHQGTITWSLLKLGLSHMIRSQKVN